MNPPQSKRFLAPILFVVLLGVSLTTAISYFHTKRSVEELAIGQMKQTLGLLDKDVTEKVRAIESNIIFWSREEVFRLALAEGYLGRSARLASDKRLAERVAYYGYDRANLVMLDGNVVSSSVPSLVGTVNIADRNYFRSALNGQTELEVILVSRFSNMPVVVVSSPVKDQHGTMLGVMVLIVDLSRLARDILDGVRIGLTGGAYILDVSDTKLAAPSWGAANQFNPSAQTAKILRSAGKAGVVRYQAGQTERMAVAVTNSLTGWLLVVEADADEVLSPAARLATLNGVISLLILALVVVSLGVVRKSIIGLRDSEARYRILAETTPVGIITFDKQYRVAYMNQRALNILGLTPNESREVSWTSRFETREGMALPVAELPMAQAMSRHKPMLGRTAWYRNACGERAVLSLSAAPFKVHNEASTGVVVVIEDVTERTRIHEMMVQTEKMLSVGGLAAGMAHEINNPLASILQALQVVNRRFDPDLAANVSTAQAVGLDLKALRAYMRERGLTEFLSGMQEAGGRAAKIVRNMLGFARKSGGEYSEADLGELLDKTIELAGSDYDFKKQYDFRQIEIVREYQKDMGKVECQPMEVEQVFFNIIKNAAQALKELLKEGPSPRLTLRTRSEGSMAVVEIEDNGPGMPEEARKRAFEPFYTTKSVGVGTGLGLSVAYFIVAENHKGSISVESAPGMGAKFIVRLPFRRVA